MNSQNDRMYAPVATKKCNVSVSRLLRTRTTFSKSVGVMVSVAISKLGCTNLVFVEPKAKINGQYYRDMLLMQELLPAIRSIAGDVFVFQQDNTPENRGHQTVERLRRETPEFTSPDMWPANDPDLNPVTASVAWCRSECIRLQSVTWSSCDSGWSRRGVSSSRPWWTTSLTSGEHDSKLVFRQTVVISNSTCDVVCGTIFPQHSTTSSFQSHPRYKLWLKQYKLSL